MPKKEKVTKAQIIEITSGLIKAQEEIIRVHEKYDKKIRKQIEKIEASNRELDKQAAVLAALINLLPKNKRFR